MSNHLSSFQVEDRLKFYETGDLPKKNLEAMQEALEEVQKEASEFKTVEGKKKKKKDKKVSEVDGVRRGQTGLSFNRKVPRYRLVVKSGSVRSLTG